MSSVKLYWGVGDPSAPITNTRLTLMTLYGEPSHSLGRMARAAGLTYLGYAQLYSARTSKMLIVCNQS